MYFDVKKCGKRIQLLRKQKRLTQLQMSFKVNVSEGHMAAIEQGSKTASIDLLIEIAVFFDVTLDYLILGKSETKQIGKLMQELDSISNHIEKIRSLL